MINSEQIKEYISLGNTAGFFGYGKWSSDIYLIGIEEAGGYSESLIQQKINRYFQLNCGDDGLFDNRTFQYDLTDIDDPSLPNYQDFFDGNLQQGGYVPKIAALLKILENSDLDKYEYVCQKLGARNSNHSLIEILPLPCPKVSDWKYPEWIYLNELPFMNTKAKYINRIIEARANFIKNNINENDDKKLIVFLANGIDKINYWNMISPIPINNYERKIHNNIPFHIENNKMYVIVPFPGSFSSNGIFNSEMEIINIGNQVKTEFDRL